MVLALDAETLTTHVVVVSLQSGARKAATLVGPYCLGPPEGIAGCAGHCLAGGGRKATPAGACMGAGLHGRLPTAGKDGQCLGEAVSGDWWPLVSTGHNNTSSWPPTTKPSCEIRRWRSWQMRRSAWPHTP